MPKKKPKHHADRYAQLSKAFLVHLRRYLPGFAGVPRPVQVALLSMIMQAPNKYREHSHNEGWASFNYQELERKFGRNGFKGINDRLRVFDVDDKCHWGPSTGTYTRSYMLTSQVTDLRTKFLKNVHRRTNTALMTEAGEITRSLPKQAQEAKLSDGQTSRSGFKAPIVTAVPVNQDRLRKLMLGIEATMYAYERGFIQELLFGVPADPQYLEELWAEAAQLIQASKNTVQPGAVIHRYRQSESGRLYARNLNLQNAYTPVRKAALLGMYDYDIENCHYSILSQMAGKIKHQCGAIHEYLDKKNPIRLELAHEFGLTIEQVKQSLIALIYGAKHPARSKDSLAKILGGVDLAKRFADHPIVSGLKQDIAQARGAILKVEKRSRGTIKNLRGLTMRVEIGSNGQMLNYRQLLSHLLQGVESVALEAMHAVEPASIVLLQHDGFTSTKLLDTRRLEQAIEDKTGYRLEVALAGMVVPDLDGAGRKHPYRPKTGEPENPIVDNELRHFPSLPC